MMTEPHIRQHWYILLLLLILLSLLLLLLLLSLLLLLLLMQMLLSDWLSYSYTVSGRWSSTKWRRFFRFNKILKGTFWFELTIKFLRKTERKTFTVSWLLKSWNYWRFNFKFNTIWAIFLRRKVNNTSKSNWKPLFEETS